MKYYHRILEQPVIDTLNDGKIAVLYGPRQVGKTTLAKHVAGQLNPNYLYLNCDELDIREALSKKTSTEILRYIGVAKMVVIDEAQRVDDIGITLKLLVDTAPEIQIIATGSSSFELANSINEPLTGRAYYFTVWPLSLTEISDSNIERRRLIDDLMIYGSYPVIALQEVADREQYLANVTQNYLYRDLMNHGVIRSESTLVQLLQLLALQIGGEVNLSELSRTLGVEIATVKRLIDLLEKAFIIHRLQPLARNARTSVRKPFKLYFVDLGVRNQLIGNLNPLNLRNDTGALWENFCVNELRKRPSHPSNLTNTFFWRNYAGAEVDYIEEHGGMLHPYEFKWGKKNAKLPKAFQVEFPSANDLQIVNRDNIVDAL